MSAIQAYYRKAQKAIEEAFARNEGRIECAAEKIAECLMNGGMLYAFGTGHAHMLAEELFYRAGGLAAVYPILDDGLMLHVDATASTALERTPGVAQRLLKRYPVKEGDVMIVCSNSGRNAAPVEMAIKARELKAYVIALTNVRHSERVSAENPYGMKLMEAADLVLDNAGCYGDAAVSVYGQNMGATSTVVGAALLQALTCRAAELAWERGQPLAAYVSGNVEGGDEGNRAVIAAYKGIIHCL